MKKILLAVLVVLILVPVVLYVAFPDAFVSLAMNMERRASGLTEKSAQVGRFTVSYLEGGKGEDVVLLHGYSADKSNWVRFAKYLTPRYHVVVPDLPGFGRSSRVEGESYSITAQAVRLNAIADALGISKFHVAGNSMGGAIAGLYAAENPGRVLSLGLFDTGGAWPCPQDTEFHKEMLAGKNALLVNTPEDFDRVLKLVFVTPPFIPRPIKNYLASQSVTYRAFTDMIGRQLNEEKFSLIPDLGKITVKTLILWGDKDRLIDVSCVGPLEKGLSRHVTVIMKDCGHIPMLERPREAADDYLTFLREP